MIPVAIYATFIGDDYDRAGTAEQLARAYNVDPATIRNWATPRWVKAHESADYGICAYEVGTTRRPELRPSMRDGDVRSRDLRVWKLYLEGHGERWISRVTGLSMQMVGSALSRVRNGRYGDVDML